MTRELLLVPISISSYLIDSGRRRLAGGGGGGGGRGGRRGRGHVPRGGDPAQGAAVQRRAAQVGAQEAARRLARRHAARHAARAAPGPPRQLQVSTHHTGPTLDVMLDWARVRTSDIQPAAITFKTNL